MARVYKEFKQNGKAIKKWVEEYIAFEFDEDGNIISDTSEYGDNADEYDENGNRTDIPWCFENDDTDDDTDDDSEVVFKSKNNFIEKKKYTEKIGNQFVRNDGYKEIVWNTKDGLEVYNLYLGRVDLESLQKEFDEDNNLIYMRNDNSEYFFEYDENKLIHLKRIDSDDDSFEKWFEYDGEKLEHSKDSDGEEYFYRYDSKDHLVYKKNWKNEDDDDDDWSYDDDDENDTWVHETEYKYDSNGKLLHKITTSYDSIEEYDNGNSSSIGEICFEYDSSGKKILAKDSSGKLTKWDSFGNIVYEMNYDGEYKNEYNSSGKMIRSIHKIPQDEKENPWSDYRRNYEKRWNDNGKLVFCLYSNEKEIFEYNENNKLIHYIKVSKEDNEDSKYEEWCEYNDGVLIHKKCSDGEEYKYNSQGKLIYYRDSDLETYWNECDSNGNPIHFKSDEVEEWYEYELYDNGNIKKKTCYRAI